MQNKYKIPGPLKVSLHGMNNYMQKMIINYLEITCQGIAHVVDENEAQAEIIDLDSVNSKSLLKERLAQQPTKPMIALSLQEISIESVIFVKKPIETPNLINAIKKAKESANLNKTNKAPVQKQSIQNGNPTSNRKSTKPLPSSLVARTKKTASTSITPTPKPASQKKNSTRDNRHLTKSGHHSSLTSKPKKSSKKNISTEIKKPVKTKTPSNQKTAKPFSINVLEIDKLLKEIRTPFKKFRFTEKKKTFSEKNNRKSVRYTFDPINANLKKKSFTGSKRFEVSIKNLSSRGAVIELKKPSKLRGKVTLRILFDSQHIFIIPAKITRKEGTSYGIQFLNNQHELLDFQIDSGHSFVFA